MNRKPGVLISILLIILLAFITNCSSKINLQSIDNPVKTESPSSLKGLLLVNFETEADDGLPWGPYCARVLNTKLHYAPDEIMYIPFPTWIMDDMFDTGIPVPKTTPLDIETEKYYAKVYCTQYILHGKIIKTSTQLTFKGYIYDCAGARALPEISITTPLSQPEILMNKLSHDVVTQLKVVLSPGSEKYLQLKNTGNGAAFQWALKGFAALPTDSINASQFYYQALQADKDFIFAYVGYSDRMSAKDLKKSMEILQLGIQHYPENGYLKEAEILRLGEMNQPEELARKSQALHQLNPDDLTPLCYEAFAYSSRGDFDRAEKLYQEALQKSPGNARVLYSFICCEDSRADLARKGRVFSDMSQEDINTYDKYNPLAYRTARTLLELHPRSPKVISKVINLSFSNNMPREEIESLFTRCTAINPHYFGAYNSIYFYYTTGWQDDPEALRDLLAEGLLLNHNDLRFAQLVYENINWYKGDYFKRSLKELPIFQADTATLRLAQSIIRKYADANPKDEMLNYQAAELYRKSREFEISWKFFERIPDPPEFIKGHEHEYFLHKAWAAQGVDNSKAEAHYTDLCVSAGPCPVCRTYVYLLQGHLLYLDKKYPEAFNTFQKAIDYNPEMRDCYVEYAYWAAESNYSIDKGIEYIKKAIDMNPEKPLYYEILSRLYLAKKDKPHALLFVNRALQMDPGNAEYLKNKQTIMALP